MPVPSLKASMFQFIADELQELVSSGRLSQTELERRLDPDDQKYLGKTLATSSWVPIATSSRVLKLLFDLDGGSDIRIFMRERGRANALKLKDGGISGQFDAAAAVSESLQRAGGGDTEYLVALGREAATTLARQGIYKQLGRQAGADVDASFVRTLVTLAKALYSFTSWELESFDADAGTFVIRISGAGDYPDSLRWRNCGFLETMTSQAIGRPCALTSERKPWDCIRFQVQWRDPKPG
jgi:hypothetical protein